MLRGDAAGMTVVGLDNIGKSHGAGADGLHDISLTLETGDFCFITGARGAGKTTLLNIIALADKPSSGTLILFDTDALEADRATRSALRRRIGIVFQEPRLLDHLSVADNIGLPLRIAGTPEMEIRQHVGELADWLGIAHRIDSGPQALSIGERKRAAAARAIVSRPDLLIADEPMDGVDDETVPMLMRAFEQLHNLGTTVLVATHDLAFARHSGRPSLHLDRGALAIADDGAAG